MKWSHAVFIFGVPTLFFVSLVLMESGRGGIGGPLALLAGLLFVHGLRD